MAYWEWACFQSDLVPTGLGRLYVELLGCLLVAIPGLLIVKAAQEPPNPTLCDLASLVLSAKASGFIKQLHPALSGSSSVAVTMQRSFLAVAP